MKQRSPRRWGGVSEDYCTWTWCHHAMPGSTRSLRRPVRCGLCPLDSGARLSAGTRHPQPPRIARSLLHPCCRDQGLRSLPPAAHRGADGRAVPGGRDFTLLVRRHSGTLAVSGAPLGELRERRAPCQRCRLPASCVGKQAENVSSRSPSEGKRRASCLRRAGIRGLGAGVAVLSRVGDVAKEKSAWVDVGLAQGGFVLGSCLQHAG